MLAATATATVPCTATFWLYPGRSVILADGLTASWRADSATVGENWQLS